MIFDCHPLTDGHPYCGGTIGWCVIGDGKAFIEPYLQTAKERVLHRYPDATFEERFSSTVDEVPVLKLGRMSYAKWIRDGRPGFDLVDGNVVWWDQPIA